jgi:hypothetical protein
MNKQGDGKELQMSTWDIAPASTDANSAMRPRGGM